MENLKCWAEEFRLDQKGHNDGVQIFKQVNGMILEVL